MGKKDIDWSHMILLLLNFLYTYFYDFIVLQIGPRIRDKRVVLATTIQFDISARNINISAFTLTSSIPAARDIFVTEELLTVTF